MKRRIDIAASVMDRWNRLQQASTAAATPTGDGHWYRIANAAVPEDEPGTDPDPDEAEEEDDTEEADEPGAAVIDIYGTIGGYGITAAQFVNDLRAVDADQIELHINSGGGAVYEALAIYNALIDHPANVVVHVDGIAASAASFIAQAGDRVVMGRNSEMMIHDGIGMTMGNAALHREMADLLDKASDNIAAIYASRAGKVSASVWRTRMKAETWYSADEAVAAGLADEAAKTERRSGRGPEASIDRSQFVHAGRSDAPAPPIDVAGASDANAVPAAAPVVTINFNGNSTNDLVERVAAEVRAAFGTLAAESESAPADAGELPEPPPPPPPAPPDDEPAGEPEVEPEPAVGEDVEDVEDVEDDTTAEPEPAPAVAASWADTVAHLRKPSDGGTSWSDATAHLRASA